MTTTGKGTDTTDYRLACSLVMQRSSCLSVVRTLPPYTPVFGSGRTSYSPLLDKPHPYVQLPRKANIVCSGREDAENREVRRSYLLIHEVLSISCSQAHCIPKRKEIYRRDISRSAPIQIPFDETRRTPHSKHR